MSGRNFPKELQENKFLVTKNSNLNSDIKMSMGNPLTIAGTRTVGRDVRGQNVRIFSKVHKYISF